MARILLTEPDRAIREFIGGILTEFGHDVVCIDKDASKVQTLKSGGIPIYEPGLDDVVADNAKAGRLSFTTDLKAAVAVR